MGEIIQQELEKKVNELTKKIEKLEKENFTLKQYKEAMDKVLILSKTDPQGIITEVNPMFEKISGYSKEELIGKPHNIVRHPDMPKVVFKKMWDTIQKGKIFKGIIKNKKKDGSHYWVLAHIIPIFDEEGNIREYLAIREDITKRMDLQETQKEIKYLTIKYFLNKIVPHVVSLEKYVKFIEVYAKKENTKEIKKALIFLKRELYITRLTTRNFEFLLNSFNKNINVEIEPLQIEHVIQKLLYKFYSIYPTKKAELKIKGKNHIINTDKKLFYLMIENFIYFAFSYAKSRVRVLIYPQQKNIIVEIEQDGENFENFKVENLNIQKYFEKNLPLEMYISQKILMMLEYKIEVKNNKIKLSFSLMPPKKFL